MNIRNTLFIECCRVCCRSGCPSPISRSRSGSPALRACRTRPTSSRCCTKRSSASACWPGGSEMRIHWFSPLAPAPTDIAHYTGRLLAGARRAGRSDPVDRPAALVFRPGTPCRRAPLRPAEFPVGSAARCRCRFLQYRQQRALPPRHRDGIPAVPRLLDHARCAAARLGGLRLPGAPRPRRLPGNHAVALRGPRPAGWRAALERRAEPARNGAGVFLRAVLSRIQPGGSQPGGHRALPRRRAGPGERGGCAGDPSAPALPGQASPSAPSRRGCPLEAGGVRVSGRQPVPGADSDRPGASRRLPLPSAHLRRSSRTPAEWRP